MARRRACAVAGACCGSKQGKSVPGVSVMSLLVSVETLKGGQNTPGDGRPFFLKGENAIGLLN
jgi:hypothetical protein